MNNEKFKIIIIATFFALLICYYTSFSQVKIDTGKTIYAGIFISPDYTIGLVPYGVDLDPGFNTRYVDKGIFAYTAGVFLDFKIRKRVNFSAGFSYSKKGFDTYYYIRNINNGFKFHDTMITEHRYYMYEIPIKLKYYFLLKKISLFGSAAMGVTLPKHSSHKVIYANVPYRNPWFIEKEKRNLSFSFGIGADINIKGKTILTLLPEYRFLRNYLQYPSFRQLYTFGLSIGIKYEI